LPLTLTKCHEMLESARAGPPVKRDKATKGPKTEKEIRVLDPTTMHAIAPKTRLHKGFAHDEISQRMSTSWNSKGADPQRKMDLL